MLTRVRELVLPSMTSAEPIQAWIINDTGFPKKGTCSVGVARRYCGQTGKQDNCQVAVSLSVATHQASLPIAYRLYLPKDWADDAARRAKVGVPDTIRFQTKPDIALEQIRAMRAAGVPAPAVLFDPAPAYGNDKFRAGVTAEGLPYEAGVFASLLVWRPGEAPQPQGERDAARKPGETRPQPVQVKTLAMELPTDAWHTITWREGSNMLLVSRFTRQRVRPAPQAAGRSELAAEQWLLIEWPVGEAAPDHYWLSTLPADIGFERMVDLAKLRWRIERSSGIISNSSKRSDWATSMAGGGEAFITMPVSASRPMASWSLSPSGGARAECRRRSGVPVGHRGRARTRARASRRRSVAMEFGMWRCVRSGSTSGSVISLTTSPGRAA